MFMETAKEKAEGIPSFEKSWAFCLRPPKFGFIWDCEMITKYTYLCLYHDFPDSCGTWLFISVITHCEKAMPMYFSSVLHPLLMLYRNIQVWLKK